MSGTPATRSDVLAYRGRWVKDPEVQRRHRLLRALHELLDSPIYEVIATMSKSGEKTVKIAPASVITDEAREFAKAHKQDLHEAVLDLERERIRREDLERRETKLQRQWDALADPELAEDDAKFDKFVETLKQYEMAWDAPISESLEGAA